MRLTSVMLFLVSICCLAGCSQRWEKNSEEDREAARETLVNALDAWKSGQISGLSKREPPIRFVDDDFQSGLRLTEYELVNEDAPIDPFRDVEVELTLRDAQGQTVRKVVKYQVGLDPGRSVLRSDN